MQIIANTRWFVTSGLVLLALSAVSLGSSIAFAQNPAPLRVGYILPLSGKFAEYGEAIRNGLALSAQDFPLPVSEIFEDGAYNPAQGLSALRKIAPSVDLIYAFGTDPNEALAPVAEQMAQPLVAVTIRNSLSKNRRFVVTFSYPAVALGDLISKHLKQVGATHVGVIKAGMAFVDGVQLAAEQAYGTPFEVISQNDPHDNDFRTALLRASKQKMSILGAFLPTGQLASFYRQMAELNLSMPTVALSFLDSAQEISAAGKGAEGAVFATPFVSESFRARYQKSYGKDAQIGWAVNGYEFGKLLRRIERGPKETILDRLCSVTTFEGDAGKVTLSRDNGERSYIFPAELRVVRGGRSVSLR